MRCPFCDHLDSKVIDSRPTEEGNAIRRRRECIACSNRFTTYEKVESLPLSVIKKDKTRQQFDREKLLVGITRACEKRPVETQQLEELVLDRDTIALKLELGSKLASIVYEGKWFTPVREAISAFVDVTQQCVTGEVKLRLYKGNIIKNGTTSPYSLYSESLASFTTGDMYDHHDAEGFITLWGLPLKVRAMRMKELKKDNTK